MIKKKNPENSINSKSFYDETGYIFKKRMIILKSNKKIPRKFI